MRPTSPRDRYSKTNFCAYFLEPDLRDLESGKVVCKTRFKKRAAFPDSDFFLISHFFQKFLKYIFKDFRSMWWEKLVVSYDVILKKQIIYWKPFLLQLQPTKDFLDNLLKVT